MWSNNTRILQQYDKSSILYPPFENSTTRIAIFQTFFFYLSIKSGPLLSKHCKYLVSRYYRNYQQMNDRMRDEKKGIKMLIFLLLNLYHFLLVYECWKKTINTALMFNHIYFQHGRFSYIIDQFDHQNIYKILGAILV